MSKSVKIKYPIRKAGYTTRAMQSILQYGVGSMIEFPNQTLMTAAPEFWAGSVTEIHDSRLEKALGVKYFGMPGTRTDNGMTKDGISYVRFPEWYFCPICRRFRPLKCWIEDHRKYASERAKKDDNYMISKPRCYKDNCDLVASGLITVCANGHIDDFPWIEWAHIKGIPKKEVCNNPQLSFRTGTSVSDGMQGLVVECDTCKAWATLRDAFTPNVFGELIEMGRTEFCCQGKHPWKGSKLPCGESPVTKQRGDTSVYFSCVVSSIVIPTSSDENINKIKESASYRKILITLEDCDDENERIETINKRLDKWTDEIAGQLLRKPLSVKIILKRLLLGNESDREVSANVDSAEYKYEEFSALSGTDERSISGSEDFLREEMNIAEYGLTGVEKVILVKKLREVRALIGFSRVQPLGASSMDASGFVCIKEPGTNWYPGYEVKGEGIFIQFDQDVLKRWAQTPFVIRRRERLLDNYSSSTMSGRINEHPDAEFVFLHTLSHLLLKQLSFECGYNIASLRERLYYMPKFDDNSGMAGILLYTASGDSEGTLGGLVRQGRRDCFPRIFKEAVDKARMCSNDPVCITSNGQGRETLNLAACHSCGLIPETSCEKYNILLDRALVVGTFEEPNGGFYSTWEINKYQEPVIVDSTDEIDNMVSVEVCDDGQKQTGSYKEIWDYIKEDTDNEEEQRLFEQLAEKSTGMYEKPIYGGRVRIDGDIIDVDLIWEKSQVMLFLTENYGAYQIAAKSSWTCFCIKTNHIDAEQILQSIEVK